MRHSMLLTVVLALVMTASAEAQVELKEATNQAEPTMAAQPAPPSISSGIQTKKAAGVPNAKRSRLAQFPAPTPPSINAFDSDNNLEMGGTRIDRIVFNRLPILVALKTGQERILSFQHAVTLNVPEELQTQMQQLDIIDNAIYLTAATPLPRSRVVVQDLVTGQMIPLDLQASKEAMVSRSLEIFTANVAQNKPEENQDNEVDNGIDMVTLTRYAAHMLYAPRRLITPPAGIRQVKVVTKPVTGLYRGALLETTPIGAWRSRDLYVTAVKVVNLGKLPVELDLNELRGQWLAATAQHGMLAAAGSDNDTTAVYLVSARPFEESR